MALDMEPTCYDDNSKSELPGSFEILDSRENLYNPEEREEELVLDAGAATARREEEDRRCGQMKPIVAAYLT